jgi:hypothetical protein
MKRRSLSLVGVCVAIIVLAYGAWMGVECRHFCRGGWDWIFYALFAGQDTTEFAPQFDEAKFSRIVKGMDRNQVLGVLGEPLAKYPEGNCDETWHYSRGAPGLNYWFRLVWFDCAGKVLATQSYYWVD